MARREKTSKNDPIPALKDEVARLALEGARRVLWAARPPSESEEGPAGQDDLARERDLIAMANAYVEIAERARNLDERY